APTNGGVVKARHLFLATVPSLMLATSWPRVAAAQSTLVVVSVRDSTGAPVLPSRIDVLGMSIFALGDSLGRVVLSKVPGGRRTLQVRGIGFEDRKLAGVYRFYGSRVLCPWRATDCRPTALRGRAGSPAA